jgi:hypothetical protein
MANAERGEVAFQAGGKDYTLRLHSGAIAAMETAYKPMGMVLDELGKGSMSALAHIMAVAATPALTVLEAFEIIDTEGFEYCSQPVGKALELCTALKRSGDAGKSKATAE